MEENKIIVENKNEENGIVLEKEGNKHKKEGNKRIITFIIVSIIIVIIILLLLKKCTFGNEANIESSQGSNITSNQLEEVSNSNINIDDDTSVPLTIDSIKGNPSNWTNKDVTIEVNVNKSDVSYSFDGGKTWQLSNKHVVTENKKITVMAKTNDEKYNISNDVIISKIDKERPELSVSILSTTSKEIIVQAVGTDKLSKNVKYSVNNGSYSTSDIYSITKTGLYTFVAKDDAGNISDKISLNITDEYFKGDDNTIETPTQPVYPHPQPPVEPVEPDEPVTPDEPVVETKLFSVTFNWNGSSTNTSKTISCITTTDSCTVTTPEIVRNDWEVVGWNTSSTARDALVGANEQLTLTESGKTYYAITKKVLSGTFNKVGTDNDEVIVNSCTIYNKEYRCTIDIPTFNKTGAFNVSWAYTANGNPISSYRAGTTIWIKTILELYTSFKHPYYTNSSNLYKERDLDIAKSITVGDSLFEYETGIPLDKIDNHHKFMQEAYAKVPWLFVPGKTFVLTYETFDEISMAYGVTYYSGAYYFIDLKYDSKGAVVKNEVDDNATLHELAHAWDSYYNYRTSSGRISAQSDIKAFYNGLSAEKRKNLSITEWFAGATTEYYWHYLGMNPNKPSYAGFKDNYTEEEQKKFVELLEKYINISMNGYKK